MKAPWLDRHGGSYLALRQRAVSVRQQEVIRAFVDVIALRSVRLFLALAAGDEMRFNDLKDRVAALPRQEHRGKEAGRAVDDLGDALGRRQQLAHDLVDGILS